MQRSGSTQEGYVRALFEVNHYRCGHSNASSDKGRVAATIVFNSQLRLFSQQALHAERTRLVAAGFHRQK